jgi:hypothetical protein
LPDVLRNSTNKIKIADGKINLLAELSKINGKGKGYSRWAQKFNLEEIAKTIAFITRNNISDFAELEEKTAEATESGDRCTAC